MKKGDTIVQVRNTQLAAALITVGIPTRKDPACTKHINEQGRTIITWNFQSSTPDGFFKASDLIQAWSRSEEFVVKNGTHPFAYAMQAIKNYRAMVEYTHNQKPFVAYTSGDTNQVAWVIEGSEREQQCIASGLTRQGV